MTQIISKTQVQPNAVDVLIPLPFWRFGVDF
jgi:hypothetical protein